MILDTAANAERLKHVHPGSGPRSSFCEGRTWLISPRGAWRSMARGFLPLLFGVKAKA